MSEIKLRRPIERWQNCDPNVMAMQSEAALRFAFSDMRHDILALHKELERLRAQVAELKGERDRLQEFRNIVDGINPLTLRKAKMLTEKGYRVAGFCLEKVDDDKCFIRHAHVTWVKDEEA